jgi:gamma-glutamyl phosphate reductase
MRLNFQPLHSLCNAAESFVVASGAAHNFLPKISAFHATE